MAKNIFFIGSLLRPERKSIQDLGDSIIKILVELGNIDDIFLRFTYSKEGFEEEVIDVEELGAEEAAKRLADLILLTNKADIKKHEKEENPTLGFSRDIGFRLLLKFFSGGQERFSLTGSFATDSYPGLMLEYFNSDHQYSYDWYHSILKSIVDFLDPLYAGIYIQPFMNWGRELKVQRPLGWITYFSNDYDLQFPDDLEGVEYEYTDNGKYLITSREDFTADKEHFLDYKEKLLGIIKEAKSRIPEYSTT